jgi:molecular chaperone DnaK (HSP70)
MGLQLNKTVNADEAVAVGATIQSAILDEQSCSQAMFEKVKVIEMEDVTPLSLGIETKGEKMSILIDRNTPTPAKKTNLYWTSADNQKSVCFQVYEGERERSTENHKLGEFNLYDLPLKPKGQVKFDVTFAIDCDGILTVHAVEQGSDNQDEIKIQQDKGRFTEDEV